ncbi:unnamed protein product [Rotaria sp. Silwood1]|nr:unnamed protein product [Rotaria sp. Silwood1]
MLLSIVSLYSVKIPRGENNSLNFSFSNQSCSSSSLSSPSSSSSSITTNTLTCSSPYDYSSTDVCTVYATNSSLNTESLPPKPKSSSKMYPADVSQTTQDSPAQPHLAAYPTGKENRSFQEKWYVNRPWLEYSVELDSVFCYYCHHVSQCSTPTRIQRDSFTVGGFNNWKRALARDRGFDRHVKSQTHIISSANFFEYQSRQKSNTTVIHVLEKSRADQIRNNRNKLINISSAILLCAKQLLALHGHDESIDSHNHGNLIEILKWSAQTDPLAKAVLKESAGNATYLSHQIQDELLHIMANQIRDSIAEKLHGNVYGLLADEATDVSHNKQLSICLRLVDDQYEIKEFFLGFIRLYLFDADTLAKEITVLQELQDLIDDGGGRAVDARVCTDLDSAQNLITTISEQLKLMRDENSFKDLFHRAITFGNENDVNMNGSIRMRRKKTIPTRFKNGIVTLSVGHRDYNTSEENFRVTMYFPTIDSILIELNERFSCHNLQIANSISSLSPMNEKFLDTEMLQPLKDHLRLEKKYDNK